MKTTGLSIVLCCLFFSITVFGQVSPSDTALTSNPLYEKNCAKCHGKNATGRHFGGPSLASDKVASASPDDLHTIIANGKGHMPKYDNKLSPEEIDVLVQQIKALPHKQ